MMIMMMLFSLSLLALDLESLVRNRELAVIGISLRTLPSYLGSKAEVQPGNPIKI